MLINNHFLEYKVHILFHEVGVKRHNKFHVLFSELVSHLIIRNWVRLLHLADLFKLCVKILQKNKKERERERERDKRYIFSLTGSSSFGSSTVWFNGIGPMNDKWRFSAFIISPAIDNHRRAGYGMLRWLYTGRGHIDPMQKGVSLFLSYTNMNTMNSLHHMKEHPKISNFLQFDLFNNIKAVSLIDGVAFNFSGN